MEITRWRSLASFIAKSNGATLGFITWSCPNNLPLSSFLKSPVVPHYMSVFVVGDEIILEEPQIRDRAPDV